MPVTVFPSPPDDEPSEHYKVWVEGRPVFVRRSSVAAYAAFAMDGPVEVEVEPSFPFERCTVRPLRHGIEPVADAGRLRFTLTEPAYLSIELDDDIRRPLFLWADPPDEAVPDPAEPGVRYFEAGKVHRPGLMELESGETVYIEGGAAVEGAVLADGAENVTVRGRGILDGSGWPGKGKDRGPRLLRFFDCRNVTVEGVAFVDSPRWTLVPVGCEDVRIEGVKIITDHVGGDGIDLVGSSDVTVRRCFARTADDCVAIKASAYRRECGGRDVKGIRVLDSVFWNAHPGNALEIGYETRCDSISDVLYRNCDIIRVEHEGYSSGGTFGIHNGDRAEVSDVRYEDIRVEDSREKLIDMKVLFARYSRDEERGQIRNVRFRDIAVVDGRFPPGIIQGYDKEHIIEDVTVEGLTVHGKPVHDAIDARMVVELARKVRFLPG